MSQTALKMTVFPLCSNERYDESQRTQCQFNKIEQWLCSQQAQTMSLGEVELAEEKRGRELLRLMLQDHVDKRGVGDVGQAIRVFDSSNDASTVYTRKRLHTRAIVGLFGRIIITRTGYGMPGQTSIHPLDELLQLPGRIYSYEVQRRLAKRAIGCPFDEAIDMIRESTGITIPKRSAEAIMLEVSRDFNDFYSSRQGVGEQLGGPILVGAIDCKGIPMIKSALTTKKVRRKKRREGPEEKDGHSGSCIYATTAPEDPGRCDNEPLRAAEQGATGSEEGGQARTKTGMGQPGDGKGRIHPGCKGRDGAQGC